MRRIKPSSSIVLVLAFVGALGVEVWLLLRESKLADRATSVLSRKIAEREWFAKQSPALTEESEQAIAADLVHAGQALAVLRATLQGPEAGWFNTHPPAKPLDAFFDLAGFVEKTRHAAAQARVGFAPDEHFGFATYSTEGPAPELLPGVYRQRLVAQRLVDALIVARPLALLGFQREAPAVLVEKNIAADYFFLNPALSLRQPGQLDTLAFRVEFSGQTATLRDFLNRIAGVSQPFIVRSVEIEPLPAVNSVTPSTAIPLVRQNFSKFTVLVEFILPRAAPAQSPL